MALSIMVKLSMNLNSHAQPIMTEHEMKNRLMADNVKTAYKSDPRY
jgi:hypothetical protein